MAITCVVLFRAQAVAPRWAWILGGYAALMPAALVYLGEHYLLDIVAGMLIASASEVAVRCGDRLRRTHTELGRATLQRVTDPSR